MRYKVLLVGEANSIIDRFFSEGRNFFECCTSSLKIADLKSVFKYFQPEIVVYCMEKEDREFVPSVSVVTGPQSEGKTPLAIVGSRSDYDLYVSLTEKNAELFVQASNSFDIILKNVLFFIKGEAPKSDTLKENKPVLSQDIAELGSGKKRILVVDDSPIMLRSIAGVLKPEYDVATAVSGKIALRYLENKIVDLILLDYEMPEENGLSVFKKLRSNPITWDIPVLFLSGVNDLDKIREVILLNPEGYLLKPVETETLMKRIHDALYEAV